MMLMISLLKSIPILLTTWPDCHLCSWLVVRKAKIPWKLESQITIFQRIAVTNNKHVRIIPAARTAETKKPIDVVPIEVDYSLGRAKIIQHLSFCKCKLSPLGGGITLTNISISANSIPGHWANCLAHHRSFATNCTPLLHFDIKRNVICEEILQRQIIWKTITSKLCVRWK